MRISQISGTEPGTLYPGAHLVKPFVEHVEIFDIARQAVHHRHGGRLAADKAKREPMKVQAKEGPDTRAGNDGALSARPAAARLHPEPPAAAGRDRTGSADGRECMA